MWQEWSFGSLASTQPVRSRFGIMVTPKYADARNPIATTTSHGMRNLVCRSHGRDFRTVQEIHAAPRPVQARHTQRLDHQQSQGNPRNTKCMARALRTNAPDGRIAGRNQLGHSVSGCTWDGQIDPVCAASKLFALQDCSGQGVT